MKPLPTNPFIIPTKRKMKSAHCKMCSIDFLARENDEINLCNLCVDAIIEKRLQNLREFLKNGGKQ